MHFFAPTAVFSSSATVVVVVAFRTGTELCPAPSSPDHNNEVDEKGGYSLSLHLDCLDCCHVALICLEHGAYRVLKHSIINPDISIITEGPFNQCHGDYHQKFSFNQSNTKLTSQG